MKFQDFFDVSVKYLAEEIDDSLFKSAPWLKGFFSGITNMVSAKGGAKWLANLPAAKPYIDGLAGLGLYNAETEEVDSEALFAFLDGYVESGSPLKLGMLKIDSAGVKSWAKRLKKAEGSDET